MFPGNQNNQGFELPSSTPITSSNEFPMHYKIFGEDGSGMQRTEVDIREGSAPQSVPPKFTILEKLTLYKRKGEDVADQNWALKQKKKEETIASHYH